MHREVPLPNTFYLLWSSRRWYTHTRFAKDHKLNIEVTDEAKEILIEHGFDPSSAPDH